MLLQTVTIEKIDGAVKDSKKVVTCGKKGLQSQEKLVTSLCDVTNLIPIYFQLEFIKEGVANSVKYLLKSADISHR